MPRPLCISAICPLDPPKLIKRFSHDTTSEEAVRNAAFTRQGAIELWALPAQAGVPGTVSSARLPTTY